MTDVRIIKRYANRKLYDTQHSRYVTLDQISEMIRNGDDVKIIDNKTKEDLTSVTLAQIIFEQEKKQRSFLSLQAMRNIIQNGGESFAQLVTEAQRRVTSILPRRKEEDGEEGVAGPGVATAGELDGQIRVGSAEQAAHPGEEGMARRGREGLLEFREWVQQSQRTLEVWQKRMDGRIRNVVEGISPFASLQKDVNGLATRIAELEAKLRRMVQLEGEVAGPARRDEASAAAVDGGADGADGDRSADVGEPVGTAETAVSGGGPEPTSSSAPASETP